MIGTAASAIWPCCIANVTAASRAGPAAEHCDALAVFAQARQHVARLQLRSLMLPPIVEVESAIKARDRENFCRRLRQSHSCLQHLSRRGEPGLRRYTAAGNLGISQSVLCTKAKVKTHR
jgi:hypothetical protein